MIQLPRHVILTCLFLGLGVSEYEYGGNSIPDDVPPLEGVYIMSAPGDNCLNTCFDAGHDSCMTTMEESLYDAANALYELVPEGHYSIWEGIWSEPYHPIVEADGTYIGWDSVPSYGGSCTAFPPDFTQRRLCRCGTFSCEDTFKFCRALTWVCHKYPYTQRSCPKTCKMCANSARDDFFVP